MASIAVPPNQFLFCKTLATYVEACNREPVDDVLDLIPVLVDEKHGGPGADGHTDIGSDSAQVSACDGAGGVVISSHNNKDCGLLLARRTHRFFLDASGSLSRTLQEAIQSGFRDVVIVATAAEISDELLFFALEAFEGFFQSSLPWEDFPRIGFITGRDLAALTWNVAKAVALARDAPLSLPTLRVYAPGGDTSVMTEVKLPGGTRVAARATLNAQSLLDSYREAVDVVAFATHGFDACADGGSGTVLCGLRTEGVLPSKDKPGGLCCGRSLPCPRGPYPVALDQFGARILVLASCNGLRLADSLLDQAFNLPLKFCDGSGTGYISTVFSAIGNEAAMTAAMAALASGRPLVEAAALSNAILLSAGLERAAYASLGEPLQHLHVEPSIPLDLRGKQLSNLVLEFDGHMATLLINDAKLFRLFENTRLGLEISSTIEGERILWFARRERDCRNPNDKEWLRLTLLRFPTPLGSLRIEIKDIGAIRNEAERTLGGLVRWLELGRLQQPDMDELWNQANQDISRLRRNFNMSCAESRFSSDGVTAATCQLASLRHLETTLRDAILDDIKPRLAGTFWLTNSLTAEYLYAKSETVHCGACGGRVVRKYLRHLAHHEERVVDVCARCGIVRDIRKDGPVDDLGVHAAMTVRAGTSFEIGVHLKCVNDCEILDFVVDARLSTLGQYRSGPSAHRRIAAKGNERVEWFNFNLPPDLRPHRFFIKVIATSPHEIAFASRVFFVI